MAIFITSVSRSKSLVSFTNRTFHLSRPPGFRRAFDTAERNGKFGQIQCQRGKESSRREIRNRRAFLCRRTVRVKVGGKAISASFLKIEGRDTLIGVIGQTEREREGRIEELVGGQNPGSEAPPRSKKRQEKREQRKCQERSNCQRSNAEGWVCQGHWRGGGQRR